MNQSAHAVSPFGLKKRLVRFHCVYSNSVVARALRKLRGYVIKESHVVVQWQPEEVLLLDRTVGDDVCISIHRDCWNDGLSDRLSEYMTVTQLEDRRAVLGSGGLLWLVECEGSLAGWGCASPASRLELWWWPLAERDWVISRVETLKAFRGRGLAPWALEQIAKECCSTGGRTFADIARSNVSSRLAFRKAGAKEIGESKQLKKL